MRIAVVGSNMVDLTAYITRMPAPGETLEAPEKGPIRRSPPLCAAQML